MRQIIFLLLYLVVSSREDQTTNYSNSVRSGTINYNSTTNYAHSPYHSINRARKHRRHSRRYHRQETPDEDVQTSFVRTEWPEAKYKKIRTYSAVPKQTECYSCMSLSYQTSWKYLQTTYIYPKVFTDRCRDPSQEHAMPTVMCGSVCVSLLEPDIEAGVLIGFKHIRGCLDRILRNGFNESAIRTHRFHQNNQCRTLSRAALFNPIKGQEHYALGEVQLCSCYGDKCNAGNSASSSGTIPWFTLLFSLLIGFVYWPRWPTID